MLANPERWFAPEPTRNAWPNDVDVKRVEKKVTPNLETSTAHEWARPYNLLLHRKLKVPSVAAGVIFEAVRPRGAVAAEIELWVCIDKFREGRPR